MSRAGSLPVPADFAPPPDAATRRRWLEAERSQRPSRLDALRTRMADEGVEAYFGARPEHMRWLTGFTLAEGEDRVSGHSGQFLVGASPSRGPRLAIHDPGRPRGARSDGRRHRLRPAWRLAAAARVGGGAAGRRRGRRGLARALDAAGGGRAGRRARPGRGLGRGPARVKAPDEVERIAAACAVADRALAALLPEIRAGTTEAELAVRLEWLIRTGGAESLAFDVACLSGPEAALPHGSPGDRPILPTPSCCSTSVRRSRAIAAT